MSRFDDELRAASSQIAREPLPNGLLDESFEATARRRSSLLLAGTVAAAVGLVAIIGAVSGRLSLPLAAEATPTPAPSQPTPGDCTDLPRLGAYSTEYRVHFPCADGSGIASGPRVGPLAIGPDEVLIWALTDLLEGPTAEEIEAGMAPAVPDGTSDLLYEVRVEPDGLAVIDLDTPIVDMTPDPAFVEAIAATALQFEPVTAVELRIAGDCSGFFAMFGELCNQVAEPVEIGGACGIIPPERLPSGAGLTPPRPYPGRPHVVSWGEGVDTVIESVGNPGDEPAIRDGLDVSVRGYPGKASESRPEFSWVEDGCPYHITLPNQADPYLAVDYALVFGRVMAKATPTPLPSAPVGSASIERDGIRITLALDRTTASFGERVWADVTVENIGTDAVHWGHSSTCTWAAQPFLHTDVEPPAFGRTDWPGDAGTLKSITVDDPESVSYGFIPEAVVGFDGNWGCTSDLVPDQIAPGERLTSRFAWNTIGLNGMPPQRGRYIARATFNYGGRGDSGANEDPFRKDVHVDVSLDVASPGTDDLSPGEAMDALLSDSTFVEKLAGTPRNRWTQSELSWAQDAWRFRLEVAGPQEALVAVVDAVTGDVSGVERRDSAR
jgi:hypothetical protein